jgi:hypothetical protein
MELIADCVHWYYLSYDHKKAIEEFHLKMYGVPISDSTTYQTYQFDMSYVPDELKQNHPLWRTGKLQTIVFDPDGIISKLYIGRNHRYAKRFFPQEVGITVKPIININCDKYDLIQAGLAINENLLEM